MEPLTACGKNSIGSLGSHRRRTPVGGLFFEEHPFADVVELCLARIDLMERLEHKGCESRTVIPAETEGLEVVPEHASASVVDGELTEALDDETG